MEIAARWARRRADLLGIAWVVAAAGLVLTPALLHGTALGPYDILTAHSLTSVHQGALSKIHNNTLGDQIRLFIPWTDIVWTQVHHGHLPLWDPYTALGLPLAFNWESAPFSLPVAIGYLVPEHLSFTVQLIVILLVAGTGVYTLGRVLGLSVLGCVTAATLFELSGPFIGWLGWPLSSVMSWAGWLLVVVVLLVQGRRRILAISLGAVVLAFSIYAGDPEGTLLVGMVAAVFTLVVLAHRTSYLGGSGPIRRPILDMAAASVTGVLLSAPLWFPGLQIADGSVRTAVGPTNGPQTIPLTDVVHLIFQGFDGFPLAGSRWFGYSNYEETAAYLGVIGLVLALTAVFVRWKRPEVRAFAAVVVVAGSLVFLHPVVAILDHHVAKVYWVLAMTPMILGFAVLAGMGMDVIVRSPRDVTMRQVAGIGFVALGLVLAMLWLVARSQLPAKPQSIRDKSFIWPAIEVVVGLIVVALLARAARRPAAKQRLPGWGAGHWAGLALLTCETAFLITAGAPMLSSSPTPSATTQGVTALEKVVGSSLVGFGVPCFVTPTVGIFENFNQVYGIHEMSFYDPMGPDTYFKQNWVQVTGDPAGVPHSETFCPVFPTAALARRFGVGYVLELPGFPGPTGARYAGHVGNEDLYKVPGAAPATLVPVSSRRTNPGLDAAGVPVSVTHPDPASWKVTTDSSQPGVLRLRLTDVPGWHATIDGRPLALEPFSKVMLQAHIPPGPHVVKLAYWPTRLSIGLVLAAFSAAGLVSFVGLAAVRGRRRRASSTSISS